MKQTAVDYLFQKLWTFPRDKWIWQHYLEKAKQMEKEQLQDAFWEQAFPNDIAFEQYYKENYE